MDKKTFLPVAGTNLSLEMIHIKFPKIVLLPLFEINKKDNRYYTMISRFKTKTEVEVALIEVQKRFNKTAYIINSENWCRETEYQKDGYYECVN